MKILLCHNFYQQPGGEDQSFAAEARLLRAHGHDVLEYTLHNDAIREMGRWEVVRRTFWNSHVFQELRELIRRERPSLLHATNTFPLISPAAYDAARAEGIPVVQSLRNYRLFCPNVFFYRDGRVCEDCLGKRFAWPGIVHKCYRRSRGATAVVAAMVAGHRWRKTWDRSVDVYFTLTQFSRQKFLEGGLPPDKVLVKPNFIDPDPGAGTGTGRYAVFVGRLSPEKGIDTLLDAWRRLDGTLPLKIVGDGPLREEMLAAAKGNPAVEWLGRQPPEKVLSLVGDATCLVMPSVWYETFGRTIIEAFSRGTPVIASRLGAMAELVDDGRTGWHFTPGDPEDLAEKVGRLAQMSDSLPAMREAARGEYLAKFTAEANYQALMSIYERALQAVSPAKSRAHSKPDAANVGLRGRVLRHLPRFRRAYKALDVLAAREDWTRSDLEALQLERLNAVWDHAVCHVPHYRDMFRTGTVPGRFSSVEEFRATVPVLQRWQVQTAPQRFHSDRAPRGRWHVSGGSTGLPTAFYWSRAGHREMMQAKYRFYAMWGLDIFDRFAFLWGHTASFVPGLAGAAARWTQPVYDRLRNRMRLSAYHLGQEELQRYLRRIDRFQPAAVYGYSTAVYLLAREALAAGMAIDSLKVAILTAEPALDFILDTTERAFEVPTVIEYGAAECGLIAGQWPDGMLRVREDVAMIETLPRSDGRFDVVLTVLVNPAFPLLRYAIGDVTETPLNVPPRGFAILEKVIGRQNDIVWTRSGTPVHPTLLMSIIGQTRAVRRYQVLQSRDGSIQVQLERYQSDLSIDVAGIAGRIRSASLGYPVSIEVVDRVEARGAGKHRWIISDMADPHSEDSPTREVPFP